MTTQSFDALMKQLGDTPERQAQHLATAFLAQVNARMQAQGMSNAELARRLGTSAGYVSKLFRGNVIPFLNHPCRCYFALSCVCTACGFAPRHK